MIDGVVVGDLENTDAELVSRVVRGNGVEGTDKRLLGQVFGESPVADHAVDQGKDGPLIAPQQLGDCALVPGRRQRRQFLVGLSVEIQVHWLRSHESAWRGALRPMQLARPGNFVCFPGTRLPAGPPGLRYVTRWKKQPKDRANGDNPGS
jgi:hypothetical protein